MILNPLRLFMDEKGPDVQPVPLAPPGFPGFTLPPREPPVDPGAPAAPVNRAKQFELLMGKLQNQNLGFPPPQPHQQLSPLNLPVSSVVPANSAQLTQLEQRLQQQLGPQQLRSHPQQSSLWNRIGGIR